MKFVIFDIDGTLADTKKVDDMCFIEAFKQSFGLDIRNKNWAEFKNVTDWGITEEIIENEFKRKPESDEIALMNSNLIMALEVERKKDKSQFKEVPGSKAFFDLLYEMEGFKIGLATGAWEESAKLKLESIGIKAAKVTFVNSNHYKSREAITKSAIEQLKRKYGNEHEEIIYFGDGIWDFKTCMNLGIRFIGIDVLGDGFLKSVGAKTVFSNFLQPNLILEEIRNSK